MTAIEGLTFRNLAETTETIDDAIYTRKMIIEFAPNIITASFRLSDYRRWLSRLGKSIELINAAKDPSVTIEANKMYTGSQRIIDKKAISPPDWLSADAISDRLIQPICGRKPSIVDVIDIIIALSLRPSEVLSIDIDIQTDTVTGIAKARDNTPRKLISFALNSGFAKQRLNWIRNAMADGTLPPLTASAYKKKIHPLRLSDLRKIGAEYTARYYSNESGCVPHEGMKMQYRRLALRHADADQPSAAEYYSNVV